MSTLSDWNVLDETRTMSNYVTFSISFKVPLLLTPWQISLIEISNVLSVALADFSYFCKIMSPYKIVSSFALQHLDYLLNRLPATRCIYIQIKCCHSPVGDHLGQGIYKKVKYAWRINKKGHNLLNMGQNEDQTSLHSMQIESFWVRKSLRKFKKRIALGYRMKCV